MATSNPYLAACLDILRLPLSPLIELPLVFQDLDMEAAAATGSGPRVHRKLVEFNGHLDQLYADRDQLLERLDRGDIVPQDVQRLRQLASRFRTLGQTYHEPLEYDPQVLDLTQRAAQQLDGWAQGLERTLAGEPAPQAASAGSSAMPDPRLLTALDRLGFDLEDLPGLTAKTIKEKFLERARRFHPDTKEAADKDFYEEQMKKLNEAKDLLLETVR